MYKQFTTFIDSSIPWIITHGFRILLIIVIAYALERLLRNVTVRFVRAYLKADRLASGIARKKRQNTLVRVFSGIIKIIVFIIAVMMILQEFGLKIGPILAGAGIVGLAVGFGGQYLIRDMISGMFIILENQYRIGDVVDFDGTSGLVEDITIRMTTIRDLDGVVHYIPHGIIKKVSNQSKIYSRVNLNIGVSYRSDLDHVIRTVNEVGKKLAEDPEWKEFVIKPPQFLRVEDFAPDSVVIKILGETQPVKQWDVAGELRKRIFLAFREENIEIPFPQRVIHQE